MLKTKYLVITLVFITGMLFMAAAVFATPVTVDTTDTINTAQIVSGRLFRDGVPSDCSGKVYPGLFAVGSSFGYTIEGEYGPVTEDGCITVTWDTLTCGVNVIPAAFLNSFDPAWGPSNATNYLGDAGSSMTGTFSFPVSAGDTFVIVFMNTTSVQGCSYGFSFTYNGQGASTAGCTLSIPDGSVVGDSPFNPQVYYKPGKVSPDLFLNPGTYIVTGQDQTETYYQIVLACQFVWVRKDTMQPSYEQPQNGAPLPTRVIDAPAVNTDGAVHD